MKKPVYYEIFVMLDTVWTKTLESEVTRRDAVAYAKELRRRNPLSSVKVVKVVREVVYAEGRG